MHGLKYVALAAIVATALALPVMEDKFVAEPLFESSFYVNEFQQFITNFNKAYTTAEEKAHRLSVFMKNYDFIHAFNKADSGVRLAVNEFADLSHDEFKSFYLGYKPTAKALAAQKSP